MEKEIFAKAVLFQICQNVQENKWIVNHLKESSQQSMKGKSFFFEKYLFSQIGFFWQTDNDESIITPAAETDFENLNQF